jgi:D-arabinan endo alpha-(1,5)-arabinofuranosidase
VVALALAGSLVMCGRTSLLDGCDTGGETTVLEAGAPIHFVAQVTGAGSPNETDQRDSIVGTDLGITWDDGQGHVMLTFGDTYDAGNLQCGASTASGWRDMPIALSSNRDRTRGIPFDTMVTDDAGYAVGIDPGAEAGTCWAPPADCAGPFCEVNRIPSGGIAIGPTNYIFYQSMRYWNAGSNAGDPARLGHGKGDYLVNYSGLARSDDDGQTWRRLDAPRFECGSDFEQVAFAKDGGFVYLLGAFAGKFGGIKIARVAEADFEQIDAYRYWDGSIWQADPTAAIYVVPPANGEMSVQYNSYYGRWILAARPVERAITAWRSAPSLTGPWSGAHVITRDNQALPLTCDKVHAQPSPNSIYGPMLHPWFNDEPNLYLNVSQWLAYNVFFLKAPFVIDETEQNLVTDPGFEDQIAHAVTGPYRPWCHAGTTAVNLDSPELAHGGLKSAILGGPPPACASGPPPSQSVMSQVLAVTPGQSYRVTAWVAVSSAVRSARMAVSERVATERYDLTNACMTAATTGSPPLAAVALGPTTEGDYRQVALSFTAGTRSLVDLSFSLADAAADTWVRIDDVAVTPGP